MSENTEKKGNEILGVIIGLVILVILLWPVSVSCNSTCKGRPHDGRSESFLIGGVIIENKKCINCDGKGSIKLPRIVALAVKIYK